MTSGIYKITNLVNGKFCIGSSNNCEAEIACASSHRSLEVMERIRIGMQGKRNRAGQTNTEEQNQKIGAANKMSVKRWWQKQKESSNG
jgi:hypothetical protein